MPDVRIRCPECNWEPDDSCRWKCSVCKNVWDTFTTKGKCPACDKVYTETICLKSRGGCGQISTHADWYEEQEVPGGIKPASGSIWFWKNKEPLPITPADKEWIEHDLLWLAALLEPVYFKSLNTIIPDKKYFGRHLTGTEEDAEFIFQKLIAIMNIDAWEIQLMFYSNRPTAFSDGIVATPSDKLEGSWKSPVSKYVDNGLGNKQIWIEEEQVKDPESLISTLAQELANFKLLNEYQIEKKNVLLAGLTAVAFGFGIFMGNSYFKFSQWKSASHQGWHMRKTGYLPEQVIAYAMAWLAHYRNEDIAWKQYLNKTMKKYFEQCYKYIEQNKDKVKLS
ncbi:MAG: hypothetical protein JWR09_5194 [Mucilaginibacter sp.]|nr:hypothetical protein [Mucilaginibacter sp.]